MRYLGSRSVELSQKPPRRILALCPGYFSRMPAARGGCINWGRQPDVDALAWLLRGELKQRHPGRLIR